MQRILNVVEKPKFGGAGKWRCEMESQLPDGSTNTFEVSMSYEKYKEQQARDSIMRMFGVATKRAANQQRILQAVDVLLDDIAFAAYSRGQEEAVRDDA